MSRALSFPDRWFYCFVTGAVFQSAGFAGCPECGQPIVWRERQDGRHAASAPVFAAAAAGLRAVA